MSKHWQPPKGQVVRIRPVGDWTRLQSYWRVHRSLPEGAKVGLIIIAVACVVVSILLYRVLGPRDIVADEVAVSHTIDSVLPPEPNHRDPARR